MAKPAATDFSESAITARIDAFKERFEKLSPETVEKPTFVYLDIEGIGWPIRCMFAVAGEDFDDVRISYTDWMGGNPVDPPHVFAGIKKLRPLANARLFPNGHVPVYVDKDVQLQESLVIMEYLAKKFGLIGDSFQEELMIKEVLMMCYDSIFHFDGIFNANFGKHRKPETYAQLLAYEFAYFSLPTKLKMFVNLLARNTTESGFMVGTRLSIADLFAFNVICNWYKAFIQPKYKTYDEIGFPELEAYIQNIANIPEVANYISTRQAPTTWLPHPWGPLMGLFEQLSSPSGLADLVAASPKIEGEPPPHKVALPERPLTLASVVTRAVPALLVIAALTLTIKMFRTYQNAPKFS